MITALFHNPIKPTMILPSLPSSGFSTSLRTFAQIINFAGTGAHHHNGVAEHTILTIMSIHAVFLHNHMPSLS
jgi:hypothetical protein